MRLRFLALLPLLACQIDNGLNRDPQVTDGDTTDPSRKDSDFDGYPDTEDCDDHDDQIFPGARERCDGIDNDCDGEIDGIFDGDADGFDDAAACASQGGELDCDDLNPAVHPDADEVCDGIDNNCDLATDDVDADFDGYSACTVDCDDTDPFIFPGAPDACDGVDNDCNSVVDDMWDFDHDGTSRCAGDCDDDDSTVHPGRTDPCDGVDNDCDGRVDQDYDVDADEFTTCLGDCDDGDPAVYPGAPEICDGKDSDCDASTDESTDYDGDGYTICDGDCDESSADAHPGGVEVCDEVDNDCSGYPDEMPECWNCTSDGTYLLCTEAQDWNTAALACEGLGGELAVITSSAENSTVAALATVPAWIGATDQGDEGIWTVPDGSYSTGYDNFSSGEPDGGSSANCAAINEGGRRGYWGDESCSSTLRFVCEM